MLNLGYMHVKESWWQTRGELLSDCAVLLKDSVFFIEGHLAAKEQRIFLLAVQQQR